MATRVLIADNHPMIRLGLASLVKTHPAFRFVGAADTGLEALRLAEELRPDIAVVGSALSELNGRDLTAQLLKRIPSIQVMIYSEKFHPQFVLGGLASGARAYVLKGESEAHVLAALEALANREPYFPGHVGEILLDEVLRLKMDDGVSRLTPRDRDILRYVANGISNSEISDTLGLSGGRFYDVCRRLKGKLGLATTADLVRYAVRNGLIEA